MNSDKNIVLPVCTLGNVFYYSVLTSESVVIDVFENYLKQTWRNRYDIMGPNGVQSLTVPVQSQTGQKISVQHIKIDNRLPWQRTHHRSIKTSYGSSPYYEHYMELIEPLYKIQFEHLIDFNLYAFNIIQQQLFPQLKIAFSESYVEPGTSNIDLRSYFKPVRFSRIQHQPLTYLQTFADRFEFQPNLSILDLLFNNGPDSLMMIIEHQSKAGRFTIFDPQ
jgi:hypothetical protein